MRRVRDQIDIHLIPEKLRLDDETDRDVVSPEAGAIELLCRVGGSATKTGEHFGVAVEVLTEHLGHDKDELT